MQASLRKIGNSTGLLVPRALLGELGVAAGTALDLRIEEGRLVATPVGQTRAGWREAAAALADETLDPAWSAFGNEDDGELAW
jgi:antitoxin MazE